ncbi:Zinc finger, PHD-type, partial [Sesbania bispinosa]
MMVKRNKRKKEEVAEDYCFKCKDGGHLLLCDYGDCLKAYHPQCVEKDDSFLESDDRWTCGSHSCHICSKRSKFKCFCCPIAVCGSCKYVEFAIVKGNKGFCRHCSKLAFLIEENADVDSDGKTVNFKAQDTYEGLFSEYYEIIKKEEGLNSLQVHSAYNFFKNCKKKCGMDPDEIGEGEDDTEESEDGSDFMVSDCDDLNDTAGVKSVRKKKCVRKLKSVKAKVKDKKKEFIGWGSRSLIEFLNISVQTQAENFLNMMLLRSLLSTAKKKSFLTLRKRESPEDRDDTEPFNFSRERKLISSTKSCQKLVSEERQSCFAAIVSSNLKLVYLKRSLMEELLKQPETFDGKVLGSFVRIKSNPNDYLQRNSHLLVQVE